MILLRDEIGIFPEKTVFVLHHSLYHPFFARSMPKK